MAERMESPVLCSHREPARSLLNPPAPVLYIKISVDENSSTSLITTTFDTDLKQAGGVGYQFVHQFWGQVENDQDRVFSYLVYECTTTNLKTGTRRNSVVRRG